MKKMLTKTITFFMAAVLYICSITPVKISAVQSDSEKWADAYMKIVNKMNKEDNAREKDPYVGNDPYSYGLIYFDNDSIPELVVGLNGYWVSMYTYDKNTEKVYAVLDQWAYGAGGNTGYTYLPKKNCLFNLNNDMAGAIQYCYYGKMKNHKIVSRYSKELVVYHFNDKNKNGMIDDGEYNGKSYYYYGKKKISKKKFDSYGLRGKYKPISGSLSYKQIKKKLVAKGAEQ